MGDADLPGWGILDIDWFNAPHQTRSFMSAWLIIVTGLIYGYIAIEQGLKGNYAMSVVYSGYAFSNVGLYLLATK